MISGRYSYGSFADSVRGLAFECLGQTLNHKIFS